MLRFFGFFIFVLVLHADLGLAQTRIPRAVVVEDDIPLWHQLPPHLATLPKELPSWARQTYTRCEVAHKVVAMTFDDGPHETLTPKLLNMLKERNIPVTFYMVGHRVASHPEIVKRMALENHEVANHSWSHPLLTRMNDEGLLSQLRRTHDAIVDACGVAPLTYRPPYGAARLTQRGSIQETFGYSTILWDVDPLDWQAPRTVQKVYQKVTQGVRPGSIVLLHDIHESTVNAMPSVLDKLLEEGYHFLTVTQLMQLEGAPLAVDPKPLETQPEPVPIPTTEGFEPIPIFEPSSTRAG